MIPKGYAFNHYKRQIKEFKQRRIKEEDLANHYTHTLESQLSPVEEGLVFRKGYEKVKKQKINFNE